jgi:hypothetical protein
MWTCEFNNEQKRLIAVSWLECACSLLTAQMIEEWGHSMGRWWEQLIPKMYICILTLVHQNYVNHI